MRSALLSIPEMSPSRCQIWGRQSPREQSSTACRHRCSTNAISERMQTRIAATKPSKQIDHAAEHRRSADARHRGGTQPRSKSDHSSSSVTKDSEVNTVQENAAAAAPYALGLGVALLLGAGFLFKGQIRQYLDYFIRVVDTFGPWGYAAYGAVYILLEIVAVPAIPLTMTAGVVFGTIPGTIVVSAASVAAATIAFLIARYAARDKIKELAAGNPQFKIVDRAIGKNSFKVVALLRLSPLLPLALSNYFYGLTSVDLASYVAASWLGMLPGTIAYVTAGSYGRTVLDDGQGELALEWWQVALGAAVTVAALGYLGNLAKTALKEAEQDVESEAL